MTLFEANPTAAISFAVSLFAVVGALVVAGVMAMRSVALSLPKGDAGVLRRMIGQTQSDRVELELDAAGLWHDWAPAIYFFARLVGAVGFGAAGWVAADIIVGAERFLLTCCVLAVIAAFVGWTLPRLAVKELAARLRRRSNVAIGDAVDVLLIASESGLTVPQALKFSADIMSGLDAGVADALTDAASDVRHSGDRHAALSRLAEQLGPARGADLIKSLAQMLRYGTPPVAALRALSKEVYQTRLLLIEKRAGQIFRLSVIPLVLFMLPCIFFLAVQYLRG